MTHDRIHAKQPPHHVDRWSVGTVVSTAKRDGHWVVTVATNTGDDVDLRVTLAVRDLFLGRIDAESPVGEDVWYRVHGNG